MIEKTFTVAHVAAGQVEFELPEQEAACAGCNGKCGSQVFARLFANKQSRLKLASEKQLIPGQKVLLAFDDSNVIYLSFYTYLLPLMLALLFPIILVSLLNTSELWHIVSAITGTLIGFLYSRNKLKMIKNQIKIKKVYPISLPVTQIIGD